MAHDDDMILNEDQEENVEDERTDNPLKAEEKELDDDLFSGPVGLKHSDPGVNDPEKLDEEGWQLGADATVKGNDLEETYGMHVDGEGSVDDDTVSLESLKEEEEDDEKNDHNNPTDY